MALVFSKAICLGFYTELEEVQALFKLLKFENRKWRYLSIKRLLK